MTEHVPFLPILRRALKRACPECGEGRLFRGFFELVVKCERCGCPIQPREENTYFFMYMTTAALTGLCIIGMLLMTPGNLWLGRIAVVVAAMILYLSTHQIRKSLAIAIDYYVEKLSS